MCCGGAYQRGVESISRKGLLDEVFQRHRKPTSTVDNTLGVMAGKRQLVKPRRGHYGLAPALIQRLKADCLVGSNSERSQSEREVSEVPDQVPTVKTGNNEVPAENHREVSRPAAAQGISSNYFP